MNNVLYPKRELTKQCKKCGKKIPGQLSYCKDHKNGVQFKYITLGDLDSFQPKHRSNKYTYIREKARRKFVHLAKSCEECGYDYHVQVCHKIPVSKWPKSASIDDEINARENVLFLCPNCHWEYDHPKSEPIPAS